MTAPPAPDHNGGDHVSSFMKSTEPLVQKFGAPGSLARLRRNLADADRQEVEDIAAYLIAGRIYDALHAQGEKVGAPESATDHSWAQWLNGPVTWEQLRDQWSNDG